ncbi:MAG TPA: DUF302 domain-containing protein [Actinomycetales bacterium]|nr:DUF302 domain-containing protein [Actinomycetales bacterium]
MSEHDGMGYGIGKTLDIPFDDAMTSVRDALAAQGFGVLTEIDMSATLKQKLGVDVDRQVILGACNPPLAYRAVQAEASIGLLLPCNVLVRDAGEGRTLVEAMDPQVMVSVTDNPDLRGVADEAAEKLKKALDSL